MGKGYTERRRLPALAPTRPQVLRGTAASVRVYEGMPPLLIIDAANGSYTLNAFPAADTFVVAAPPPDHVGASACAALIDPDYLGCPACGSEVCQHATAAQALSADGGARACLEDALGKVSWCRSSWIAALVPAQGEAHPLLAYALGAPGTYWISWRTSGRSPGGFVRSGQLQPTCATCAREHCGLHLMAGSNLLTGTDVDRLDLFLQDDSDRVYGLARAAASGSVVSWLHGTTVLDGLTLRTWAVRPDRTDPRLDITVSLGDLDLAAFTVVPQKPCPLCCTADCAHARLVSAVLDEPEAGPLP